MDVQHYQAKEGHKKNSGICTLGWILEVECGQSLIRIILLLFQPSIIFSLRLKI